MNNYLKTVLFLLCCFAFAQASAQITPNMCASGSSFKNFASYSEDMMGSNTGTAELTGSCVTATWSHNGAARGEEYAGDIRFLTSNGDDITLTINFSEALVNPVVYIGVIEPNNTVTISDCSGTVIASQTQLVGGGLAASGTSWINGGGLQASGSIELAGSFSCLQVNIVNAGNDDGIDIDFGSCTVDMSGPTPPIYVAALPCPSDQLIYTIDHTDLTMGNLRGITVTTDITGTVSGTQSVQDIAQLGNVDPNVPTNITSGGLLRFRMTDDGDDFSVRYTFSAPVTNSFIYIGDTGPETATVFNIFELDGTTPIPVGLIDGEGGFVSVGHQIGTNVNNVSGYVQIQDNIARMGFVIQAINGVDPPCFVGTAEPDNANEDGFRFAIGGCRPDQMTIGNATCSIGDDELIIGAPFSITVTGLTNMKMAVNGEQDFGLNFYLYPEGTGVSDFDYPPSNAITPAQAATMIGPLSVPVLIGQLSSAELTNNCTEGTLADITLPNQFPDGAYSKVVTLNAMPINYPATSFEIPSIEVVVVPTMGEWGVIILMLLMMTIGLVSIRQQDLLIVKG